MVERRGWLRRLGRGALTLLGPVVDLNFTNLQPAKSPGWVSLKMLRLRYIQDACIGVLPDIFGRRVCVYEAWGGAPACDGSVSLLCGLMDVFQ